MINFGPALSGKGKPVKKASKSAIMKRVENSKADKAMDKKRGVKEGSPADRKMDAALARKMMKKK